MTRRFRPALAFVCAAFCVFLALSATAESTITVSLDSPSPFAPAAGPVTIEAVVVADEPIERVAFYVDGLVVGELERPPYRLEIDIGQENRDHRFQVVAYGVSGATGSSHLTTPAIRVDEEVSINLQQLYITVSRDGRRVTRLDRDDFAVFDRGERQELVTFARGEIPFTAVVLLDSSISMAGHKLSSALAGARTFFTEMQPLDEGKLLVFSDRLLHTTPFTTFPEVLTAGLDRVEARGGTALNDHLYLALKLLEERQGRRVVVILSDGVDSHSVLPMTDVLARARRSQALIYWLRLPYRDVAADAGEVPRIASSWRNPEQYRQEFELLTSTVEASGGRIQLLRAVDEIEPAFRGILQELREQYVVGYYPSDLRHKGAWRKLKVRLRDPELEARYLEGYVDF